MNAILFGLKRAFQATLRVTRPGLSRLGLTAARFDMLTAIDSFPMGPLQKELRGALGVTRATISRMVRSLEELGLVRRFRTPEDRRQIQVEVTRAGQRLIRRARRRFVDSGAIQLAVDCALVGGVHFGDESACLVAMDGAESILRRIREGFYDNAGLRYRWHPDD
jgi:DNA-binding MarR family transcriptional regulator